MAVTIRSNSSVGGGGTSGSADQTIDVAVTAGDLVVVFAVSDVAAPTAISDEDSNTYTNTGSWEQWVNTWYMTAGSTNATMTITVTFGTATTWGRRMLSVLVVNSDGHTVGFGDRAKTTTQWTTASTERSTGNISANGAYVLAVAGGRASQPIGATLAIGGAAPDGNQSPYGVSHQWWTLYTGNQTDINAAWTTDTNANLEMDVVLFTFTASAAGVVPQAMHLYSMLRK